MNDSEPNRVLRPRAGRLSPVRLARSRGLHYGWVVVAVTFVLMLASAGVRTAPGVLIEPLERDLGWSRAEISWALALSLVTLGFAGPASGWLIDQLDCGGPRSHSYASEPPAWC